MVDPLTIPSNVREALVREMGCDEQMRWFGQPRPAAFMLGSLGLVLFGIPWTAFALFWTAGAAGFKVPDLQNPDWTMLFPLWGLPFIFVGLGMLSSPFWAYRRALRTAYVVTNKRAIIMEGGRSRVIRSIGPDRFSNLIRRERSNGRGDIVFSGSLDSAVQDPDTQTRFRSGGTAMTGQTSQRVVKILTLMQAAQRSSKRNGKAGVVAFLDIQNPRQVEELLRSMGKDERW
jgi:hypothetical protein